MKCSQANCEKQAKYRYTWPGHNEMVCCIDHASKIEGVSKALGFYTQLIPLEESDNVEK